QPKLSGYHFHSRRGCSRTAGCCGGFVSGSWYCGSFQTLRLSHKYQNNCNHNSNYVEGRLDRTYKVLHKPDRRETVPVLPAEQQAIKQVEGSQHPSQHLLYEYARLSQPTE